MGPCVKKGKGRETGSARRVVEKKKGRGWSLGKVIEKRREEVRGKGKREGDDVGATKRSECVMVPSCSARIDI